MVFPYTKVEPVLPVFKTLLYVHNQLPRIFNIHIGTLVKGYMSVRLYVMMWPGFDLWSCISDAILWLHEEIWYYFITLISLLYLFAWILVVAPLGFFWCRLSTVKVILEFINHFTFATSHCNRWHCIKWATGFACIATSVCMGNIQNLQTII